MAEKQCVFQNKALQIDNALKFKKLTQMLEGVDIQHRLSCRYSHQQIGSIEWRHHHLVDTSIKSLPHAHMPNQNWDYAVNNYISI